jgi:hypothetical protein
VSAFETEGRLMMLSVLSIAGDISSILAIPGLLLVYVGLYKLYAEIREGRKPKGVSEDALEFVDGRIAINLVQIASLRFLPRKGDMVMLPSERGEPGAGAYEVTDICHCYDEYEKDGGPYPARLGKVVAYVKGKGS